MNSKRDKTQTSDKITLLSTYSTLLDEYERMGISSTLAVFSLIGVILTVVSYVFSISSTNNREGLSDILAYKKGIVIILLFLVTIIINVYSYVYTYVLRKVALYRGYCGYLEQLIFCDENTTKGESIREKQHDHQYLHRDIMVENMKSKDIYPFGPYYIAIIVALVEIACIGAVVIQLWGKWLLLSFPGVYVMCTIVFQYKNYKALQANWEISETIAKGECAQTTRKENCDRKHPCWLISRTYREP